MLDPEVQCSRIKVIESLYTSEQAEVVTRGASNETGEEVQAFLFSISESGPETPPAQFDLQPPGSRVLQSFTPTKQHQVRSSPRLGLQQLIKL